MFCCAYVIGYCAGIIMIFPCKRWSVIRASDRDHEIRYVGVDNYTVGPDKRFDRLLRNRIRSLPNPSTNNEFRQSRLETAQTLLILAIIQSCLMVFQVFCLRHQGINHLKEILGWYRWRYLKRKFLKSSYKNLSEEFRSFLLDFSVIRHVYINRTCEMLAYVGKSKNVQRDPFA